MPTFALTFEKDTPATAAEVIRKPGRSGAPERKNKKKSEKVLPVKIFAVTLQNFRLTKSHRLLRKAATIENIEIFAIDKKVVQESFKK